MVYFFTTEHAGTTWTLFMGKDKFENEDLIKYGLPHDVWYVRNLRPIPFPECGDNDISLSSTILIISNDHYFSVEYSRSVIMHSIPKSSHKLLIALLWNHLRI